MAETTLWLVPDFQGTNLNWSYAGGAKTVWLDIPALAANGLDDALRLPGPQLGGAIYAADLVNYAGWNQVSVRAWLAQNLPEDWTVIPWGYDWRGGAQVLGALLANRIASAPSAPGGHRILGLGYGGLVACAAYGALVDAGKANLVPRVVTVGAPLAGTYAVCQTWRLEPSPLNTLGFYQAGVLDLVGVGGPPFVRWAKDVATFVTWPSTYDLLPDPTSWDDPGDQFRSMAWDPTQWANAVDPPKPNLMSVSQTGFRAWINANNRWPPPGVLVCAVGTGRTTPLRMVPPDPNAAETALGIRRGGLLATGLLSNGLTQILTARIQCPSFSFGQTAGVGAAAAQLNAGDGVCSLASQMRPGVQFVLCDGDHAALISHPTVRDNLLAMLTGPGVPGGVLDVTNTPEWPSYRPVAGWLDALRPQTNIAPNVPGLPRSSPSIF